MTISLSDLSAAARDALDEVVFDMLDLDDGAVGFGCPPGEYEAVEDGVWVPCRIFVPNDRIA